MILSSLNTPLSQVVHATGKMRNYQMGTSVIICAILPIAWVVLKLGGDPTSVYVVSIIMTIINQGVCMILLKRVFPYSIREYLKEVIWPCLLVSVISTVLPLGLHFLLPSSFFRLIIVAITGVGSTALVSYYMAMNHTERQLVSDYIHRFLRKNE